MSGFGCIVCVRVCVCGVCACATVICTAAMVLGHDVSAYNDICRNIHDCSAAAQQASRRVLECFTHTAAVHLPSATLLLMPPSHSAAAAVRSLRLQRPPQKKWWRHLPPPTVAARWCSCSTRLTALPPNVTCKRLVRKPWIFSGVYVASTCSHA